MDKEIEDIMIFEVILLIVISILVVVIKKSNDEIELLELKNRELKRQLNEKVPRIKVIRRKRTQPPTDFDRCF